MLLKTRSKLCRTLAAIFILPLFNIFNVYVCSLAVSPKIQIRPSALSYCRILPSPHAASNEMEHTFWSRWTQ